MWAAGSIVQLISPEARRQMNHLLKHKKKRLLLKGTDKYDKITYRDKIMLLKKVVVDDQQIKETSHYLNINYSTAKTFLRKFKNKSTALNTEFIENVCKWFAMHQSITQRCSYRVVVHETEPDLEKSPLGDAIKEEFHNTADTTQGKDFTSGLNNKKGQIKIIQQVMFQ